jgi:hypothetical protein
MVGKYNNLFVFISLSIILQSCAPVFSELQSARMVGNNKLEITPLFSTVAGVDSSSATHLQNEFGVQAIYGISDRIDFRLRAEVISYQGNDYFDSGVVIGFGPKISFVTDKVALSLPFGIGIDGNFLDELEFQPSLFLTWPAIRGKLESQ